MTQESIRQKELGSGELLKEKPHWNPNTQYWVKKETSWRGIDRPFYTGGKSQGKEAC